MVNNGVLEAPHPRSNVSTSWRPQRDSKLTPSEPPSQTVDQTRKDDELGGDDGKRRR
jgi:hypothetical protein